jgi:hypothetical protein
MYCEKQHRRCGDIREDGDPGSGDGLRTVVQGATRREYANQTDSPAVTSKET